jgi:ArsR family transcriptional regulator, arsenate/arsenite/antimonite-responsive transcriptional repressor
METSAAVTALAALAQETRLSIYRLLVEAGPEGISAGRIRDRLKVPAATLSFHLKELARAGLVASRQERQFVYYTVDFARMTKLMTFLTENCCRGMPETCLAEVAGALGNCCPPTLTARRKRRRS